MRLKFRAFALASLLAMTASSCQTSEFDSNRLREADCAAIKSWADATAANTDSHLIGFEWIHSPDTFSMYATMFTICPENRECDLSAADSALYNAVHNWTHYVTLEDFARGVATCVNADTVAIRNTSGNVTSTSAIATGSNWELDILWSETECAPGHGRISDHRLGCTTLGLKQK